MRLFALSDLHLSFAKDKPMDKFGVHWTNHAARIAVNWRATVGNGDIVLVPGDISWALKLNEALPDLEWLASLPGEKVLVRGNHDYWWPSIGKLRAAAPKTLHFVQNDVVVLEGVTIGGSRLWDFPGIRWSVSREGEMPEEKAPAKRAGEEADPEAIRRRELERLQMSLSRIPADAKLRVAMTHFPPLGDDGRPTEITRIMSEYGVQICVFGHIHGLFGEDRIGADTVIDGTRYVLASCDWLDFKPLLLDVHS